MSRWERTSRERPRWDERNRMIAAYVPPGSSVADIGAGAQTLSAHLPPGCAYQACDIVPGPGVALCDLEAGLWPVLDRRFDIAVCSGVLEYLGDIPAVLDGLGGIAWRAIVTYSDRRRGQRIQTRLNQGWKSHLSLAELRAALDSLDREWRFLTEWRGHVIIAIDFEPGLPPLRDGEALIEEATWESSFARLEAYARRTGSGRVSSSLVEDGVGLGAWVAAQRRMRRRGTLSARRTRRLEAIPGWSWRATTPPPPAAAPAAEEHAPLAGASLRPERVDADRVDWMCQAAQGEPVLDLACGQGTAAISLARAGLSVTGFDRDAAAVEQARARLSEETEETRDGLTLITGDPARLPLADQSFDTVLLGDLLDHAAEAETLLAEARRLLRARGRVVVTSLLDPLPAPRARAGSSLSELLALLGRRLRPVEVADGDRWVGVVAVFSDPDTSSPEAWSALLEIAERRLGQLGDAYGEQSVRLDETRERERELARRVEELTTAAARLAQQRDDHGRRASEDEGRLETVAQEADARLSAAAQELDELRRRLAEAQGAIAESARRSAAEDQRRAELDASLVRERERAGELAMRLGQEQSGRAGERRRLDELEGKLQAERERGDELELGLADAVRRAAEAERVREAANEHLAAVEARTTAEIEARDRRLSEVREDGRALLRESERGQHHARALEAELAAAREELLSSRAALVDEARQTAALGERAGSLAARVEELEELVAHADGREREWRAEAGRRETELAAREADTAQRIAELAAATARGQERLTALTAERERLQVQLAELEAAFADRDRRLAHRTRQAVQRDRDTIQQTRETALRERELRDEIELLRGENADMRAELAGTRERERALAKQETELQAKVRTQTASLKRLQDQLSRERTRSQRRQAQLDAVRAGRAYRLSVRWWRVRRAVRRPLSRRRDAPELEPAPSAPADE